MWLSLKCSVLARASCPWYAFFQVQIWDKLERGGVHSVHEASPYAFRYHGQRFCSSVGPWTERRTLIYAVLARSFSDVVRILLLTGVLHTHTQLTQVDHETRARRQIIVYLLLDARAWTHCSYIVYDEASVHEQAQ